MQRGHLILTAICGLAAMCAPAIANARVTVVESVEYEVVEDAPDFGASAERFVSGTVLEEVSGIATYGPFRVIDESHAALVGITDDRSPRQFAAMLRDYPGLATLELIECPGTFDDLANLELGRMIRRAGIDTRVPRGGSVRSGAVELFLAGADRTIEDGARFAVHAWEDDSGRQAGDYAISAPENRKYINYYREMGMSGEQAQAFYAMTNSVPFEDARWLSAEEMRGWVDYGQAPHAPPSVVPLPAAAPAAEEFVPKLAYLDLAALLY